MNINIPTFHSFYILYSLFFLNCVFIFDFFFFVGSTNQDTISPPKTPSELNLYVVRNDENIPTCGICYKFSNKTTTCVRNHVEAIHFPNTFVYSCPICTTQFTTKMPCITINRSVNSKLEMLFKILFFFLTKVFLQEISRIQMTC